MPVYRIPRLVETLLNVYDGSVNRLYHELQDVTGCRINQPRLRRLCKDKEGQIPLNGTELRALDKLVVHLKNQGRTDHGLIGLAEAPIFLRVGTMEAIEMSRKPVLFVLGTRRSESAGRAVHDIRSWDCRGMANVLNAMGGLRDVHVQFADCLPAQNYGELQERTWFVRSREANNCIVSIGSIHACAATEWVLSQMFGLEPFTPGQLENKLPFHFIWSPYIADRFPSSTSLKHNALPKMKSSLAAKIERNSAWGIKIGDDLHCVFKDIKGAQPMPGIFAAQGQPDGQVLVAICGITGPATFAVAKFLNQVKDELPFRLRREHRGRVLWGAVQVHATLEEEMDVADSAEISDPTWLVHPEIWPK